MTAIRVRSVPRTVGLIPTGKGAHAFRSMGDGKSVLVSNRVANTISRIDLATLKVIATDDQTRQLAGFSRADVAEVTRLETVGLGSSIPGARGPRT